MNETNSVDRNDSDILQRDVPDEALEAAGLTGPDNARAFTVAYCTGQVDCPF